MPRTSKQVTDGPDSQHGALIGTEQVNLPVLDESEETVATSTENELDIIIKTQTECSRDQHSNLRKTITLVKPENRITSDFMSLYEYQQVVSVRAKHIENGAVIYCKLDKIPNNPLDIAIQEINEKKCPLAIIRHLNENIAEYWDVNELGWRG